MKPNHTQQKQTILNSYSKNLPNQNKPKVTKLNQNNQSITKPVTPNQIKPNSTLTHLNNKNKPYSTETTDPKQT